MIPPDQTITWQMSLSSARSLMIALGEALEFEVFEDEDAEQVGQWITELLELIRQIESYQAVIQPGLAGLA